MFFDKENHENVGACLDTTVNSFPTKPFAASVVEVSGTIATVICEKFQGAVWVGFGCVPLNCTSTREFHLVNPNSSAVNITVDKCPTKKGFSITFGKDHATSISVGPSETISGYVNWTPSDNLSVREVGVLLMDNKHRLQLTLHGIAGKGTPKVQVGKMKNVRNIPGSKPVVHKVAKKQNVLKPLTLLTKTAGKSHYAEKKMEKKALKQRDDCQQSVKTDRDKCVNKQVSSLLQWVNDKLHQSLPKGTGGADGNRSDVYSSLEHCRTEEKHRRDFATILQHEDTEAVLSRVKREIISNRLSLRADRNVKVHVGFKEGITNMLLCYDPMWLKLGLETLFGMNITPPTHTKASTNAKNNESCSTGGSVSLNHMLKKVIQERVLQSEEIEASFSREGVILTPAVEKKLQEALRHHILTNVLSVVFLLDEARMNGMCNGRLTLFRPEADIRTSKGMIVELSRSFLQAEGDVIKHLSGLGYSVEFVQNSFHEFNFRCSEVTSDFKDGVRLARLVDLLAQSNDQSNLLSSLLRVPAVSRLQKLYNVGISLKYLSNNGVEIHNVDGKAIVDGNHDATMLLLWSLLFEFELKFVVSLDDIKSEILSVHNGEKGVVQERFSSSGEAPGTFLTQMKSLLLQWCESISILHQHHQHIENISESIMNGQILCLLVHHYHPNILPLDMIKDNSDSNDKSEKKVIIVSLQSLSQHNKHVTKRTNLLNLSRALKVLGGVPFMLSTEGPTDEKTMVMFLGFLFSRLVHTTKQATAASLIQRKLRSKKSNNKNRQHEAAADVTVTIYESKRQTASSLIAKFIRNCLIRQKECALQRELSVHQHDEIVEELTDKVITMELVEEPITEEAILLSSPSPPSLLSSSPTVEDNVATDTTLVESTENKETVDMDDILFADIEMEEPLQTEEHKDARAAKEAAEMAIDITNMHKMCMAEMIFKASSGVALQTETLGRLAAERELESLRKHYESSMSTAMQAQKELEDKLAFEVKEKERVRIEMEISTLEEMIRCAEVKLLRECKEYHATIILHKFGRFVLREIRWKASLSAAAKTTAANTAAAVKLQSLARSMPLRCRFLIMKASVVVIQKRVRLLHQRARHERHRLTALWVIKRWIQTIVQRERFAKCVRAVVIIQHMVSGKLTRKHFVAKKSAVKRIQCVWRKHHCSVLAKQYKSAVVIQSVFIKKSYKQQSTQRHSVLILQAFWTRCQARLIRLKRLEAESDSQMTVSVKAKGIITRFLRRVGVYKNDKRAALRLERWFQTYLPLLRTRKLVKGFLRLQALRRSVVIRRQMTREVRVVYNKIMVANAHARTNPEMKLSTRTQNALLTLQKGKMISHVLKSCQTLEYSTSFSTVCCSNFVTASASKILFALIRSCNRSTPHQELLRCALTVLINVTKDETLAEKVVHNGDTTEILVDLMQMFRDKKIIFNLSCELLTRFVFAQSDIKASCLASDMKKRLDGIMHILERKHRLDVRVRSISSKRAAAGTGGGAGSSSGPPSRNSPKSANSVSCAAPFELMQTFMTHLNMNMNKECA